MLRPASATNSYAPMRGKYSYWQNINIELHQQFLGLYRRRGGLCGGAAPGQHHLYAQVKRIKYEQGPTPFCCDAPAGVVGYVAKLRPASATNPYALTFILCAWVFIGSFLALKTEVALPPSNIPQPLTFQCSQGVCGIATAPARSVSFCHGCMM